LVLFAHCSVLLLLLLLLLITQPNMNSIIKTAAKITEELSQPNEKSDAQQDVIQHTKARLGESLKKMEKQSNTWAVH